MSENWDGIDGFQWHAAHESEIQYHAAKDLVEVLPQDKPNVDWTHAWEDEHGQVQVAHEAALYGEDHTLTREQMTQLARAWVAYVTIEGANKVFWRPDPPAPEEDCFYAAALVDRVNISYASSGGVNIPSLDMTELAKAWLTYTESNSGTQPLGTDGSATAQSSAEPAEDGTMSQVIETKLATLFSVVQQSEGTPLEWRSRYQGPMLVIAFRIVSLSPSYHPASWEINGRFRLPGPHYPNEWIGGERAPSRPDLKPEEIAQSRRFGADWCIGLWRLELDEGDPLWISSIPFPFRNILSVGYTLEAGDFYHEAERYLRRRLRAELRRPFDEGRLPGSVNMW